MNGFKNRFFALTVICLAGLPWSSLPAQAASFDCEAAELKPDEKAICDTRSLNDADVKMATTFEILAALLPMGARGAMQERQTKWLEERHACAADADCLKTAYDTRMKELDETFKSIDRPL